MSTRIATTLTAYNGAMPMKVDFFSTLAQAKELAANAAIDDLAVRCTVDSVSTAVQMMKTLIAAPPQRAAMTLRTTPHSRNGRGIR